MSKKKSSATNKVSSVKVDEEDVRKVRGIKEKYEMELFKCPAITGVGIGLMTDDDGKYTSEVGISIYYDPAYQDLVADLPAVLEGVRTQVRPGGFALPVEPESELEQMPEGGENLEQASTNPRKRRIDPMIGGIGGGPDYLYLHPRKNTIGLIVRDLLTGELMIMSTCSAICGKRPRVGDGVSQPARSYLPDRAAELVRWHKGNVNYGDQGYYIDAALALPAAGRSAQIGQIYGINHFITQSEQVGLGWQVIKSGVGGVTEGLVVNIDFTSMTTSGPIFRMFVVRGLWADFSTDHDSGSAILALNEHGGCDVVGLLNGGRGELTLCSMIDPILASLACEMQ
jgi:hypothetical protein